MPLLNACFLPCNSLLVGRRPSLFVAVRMAAALNKKQLLKSGETVQAGEVFIFGSYIIKSIILGF